VRVRVNTGSIQNNNIESDTTTKAVEEETSKKTEELRACPVNYRAQSGIG